MADFVWVVACTEYQAEPLARAECLRAGFKTFFPLLRILVPQPNRSPIRQTVAAFPGYLFVLTPFARWHLLKRMDGMAGVLHRVGDPIREASTSALVMCRMACRATLAEPQSKAEVAWQTSV